jgi:hypothetical protein
VRVRAVNTTAPEKLDAGVKQTTAVGDTQT